MNRFTRLFFVFPFIAVAVVACGGSSSETAQSSDPSSPEGFCSRNCIEEDRAQCEAFASKYSNAFLDAFQSCGDNPACIEPKLDAAPRTERQTQLANDYCSRCANGADSCATKFFIHDQPGGVVASMSDARLDEVSTTCLAKLDAEKDHAILGCGLTWTTCVIPFLQEDAKNTVVCRQRR